MTTVAAIGEGRSWIQRLPFYYGWINVVVASVAMTATLPGRTHGLGLVTEPLLADLAIDRVVFADVNLCASLLGAAFCLPVGWLIDRYGVRGVLTGVMGALGLSVVAMSEVEGIASFAAALLLVRGFGQSALSVVSMAVIGKWFRRRLGIAMGLFAVLLTFGFIASVLGMGSAVEQLGWRRAWRDLGYLLLALTPVAWLVTRSTPEDCGLVPDADDVVAEDCRETNLTLKQVLWTPAFWTVTLGTSAFNLVWSGLTLFNESMLAERGVPSDSAVEIMAILTGVGLLSNLVCGALATRERVLKLLSGGLLLLAAGLAAFPMIGGIGGARAYALAVGLAGGTVTVVFFAAWGHLFGRAELGRIQGAAQLCTVLASAVGPVVMAESLARTGSYDFVFYLLAGEVGLLAVAAMVVPLPRR